MTSSIHFPRDSPTEGLNGQGDCESPDPSNTVTDRLNQLLAQGGPGYVLHLCPGKEYIIQAPIAFAAAQQEISTYGYPTDDQRATLMVMGPVGNDNPHTTAVDGTCADCDSIKLRNIQINGTRDGGPPISGGGNIEIGGDNGDQLVEYVKSYNPRGWTCLHIAEGPFTCNNATIRYNDIGPCGTDAFQEWADGISVSCQNSHIHDNRVGGATDGGIVLFGSPGTIVENNIIWAENNTQLGGVNMVDYDPWKGNYTGTIVRNNTILGGFANDGDTKTQKLGENDEDVIMKIGIAVGPRTWFGDRYSNNLSNGGVVQNNRLSGAFGYAIAVSSAIDFTVQNNVLFDNTTFIGSRGPNCTGQDVTPTPAAFVVDKSISSNLSLQGDFSTISDGDSLTCIMPPTTGDFWPYGGEPEHSGNSTSSGSGPHPASPSSGLSAGAKGGIAIAVIGGLIIVVLATILIRRRAIRQRIANSPSSSSSYPFNKNHQ